MDNTVLSVRNLSKRYEPSWWQRIRGAEPFVALDAINFSLKKGEILGFLGANGAGKTTITQLLLGTLLPSEGQIEYFGRDFFKERSQLIRDVSFASSYIQLASRLTVYENLEFFGRLYGLEKHERQLRIEEFLKFFSLWSLRSRETGTLSAGQSTRVMLAKAFLSNPKILLLDEPTASLDPDVAQETLLFIQEQQKKHAVSIIFTSHNMEEMVTLCDRVLVLQKGVIQRDATPQELVRSVSTAKVHLVMNDSMRLQAEHYAKSTQRHYRLEKNALIFNTDEQAVASLLTDLGRHGIVYEQIVIEKPSLKDYFLHLAQQNKQYEK